MTPSGIGTSWKAHDSSTASVFNKLFDNGAVIFGTAVLPTQFFGLPGLGAYVIDAWFNERGQCDQSGNCTVDYSNTNTQDTNPWAITHNTTLSTPGTFTPLLGIQVRGDDHVIYNRQVTGTPYTVVAEQDYSPANSYATTQSKKDQLAHLIGDNINAVYLGDNTHYGYSDMMNLLTMYTDGIATQANPELDHVQVLDTTNSLMFSMKTGGNAVWGGFTQLQIQQLLNIYGVQR